MEIISLQGLCTDQIYICGRIRDLSAYFSNPINSQIINMNLKKLEFQELSNQELKSINGGAACAGLCVAAIIVVAGAVGAAVGYGVSAALDD